MLDVLVTCLSPRTKIASFPQVRGYYLAEYLSRRGLRAVFRPLPLDGLECKVLISSEYQHDWELFDHTLRPLLEAVRAERYFCLVDYSLFGRPDHFSAEACRWFAARGGVLCHVVDGDAVEPYEHWIGVGVDTDVVSPAADARRDAVLFDFPRSDDDDTAARFDTGAVPLVRDGLPGVRVLGSGPSDAPIRDAFDGWVPYGQAHAAYARAAYGTAFALVPGASESMGLALAEAQMAGASVVYTGRQVRPALLVPGGSQRYEAGDAASLVAALAAARAADPAGIRRAAMVQFDYEAVAARVATAVGLT